jgi:hypothetical protein
MNSWQYTFSSEFCPGCGLLLHQCDCDEEQQSPEVCLENICSRCWWPVDQCSCMPEDILDE